MIDENVNPSFQDATERVCSSFSASNGGAPSVSRIIAEAEERHLWAENIALRETVLDTLARINISQACIVDTCVSIYFDLLKKEFPNVQKQILKERNRPKLAYAIWEGLNRSNVLFPPQDIAFLCQVTPSSMQEAECKAGFPSTFCSSSQFFTRAEAAFEIPYKTARQIECVIQSLERVFMGRKPETLVCSAILICKDLLGEREKQHLVEISVQKLCSFYKVCAKTVNALLKKIRSMDPHVLFVDVSHKICL